MAQGAGGWSLSADGRLLPFLHSSWPRRASQPGGSSEGEGASSAKDDGARTQVGRPRENPGGVKKPHDRWKKRNGNDLSRYMGGNRAKWGVSSPQCCLRPQTENLLKARHVLSSVTPSETSTTTRHLAQGPSGQSVRPFLAHSHACHGFMGVMNLDMSVCFQYSLVTGQVGRWDRQVIRLRMTLFPCSLLSSWSRRTGQK